MTLIKSSKSDICVDNHPDGFKFASGTPGQYTDAQSIYTMSTKYADSVGIFLKMVEALPMLANYQLRAAMLASVSDVLNEIGLLASQIFELNDTALLASSDILTDSVMVPTMRLREVMVKMKHENTRKTSGLDRAIMLIDGLMDAISTRILDADGVQKYQSVSRDSRN